MKKRGIIVATIVMVLVLAVSLTTATYAWFSDDAKATVDNLTIATTASTGVQIAVYQGNTYYNGTIVFDETNKVWDVGTGTLGFGTLLDFSDVEMGNMKNAVTNRAHAGTRNKEALFWYAAVTPQPQTFAEVVDTTYYVDANGKVTPATAITEETFGKAPYTGGSYCNRTAITADDDANGGTFFRPLGYNTDLTPTGYEKVYPNTSVSSGGDGENKAVSKTSYYEIPLAMQTVQNTDAILCALSIKSNSTGNATLSHGMAAATYVRITPIGTDGQPLTYPDGHDHAGDVQQYLFQPYEKYVYNNGTMTKTGAEGANEDGKLSFVVASGDILTSDVFKLRIEIWVEGTDNECNNVLMQVTNFDIDFAFDVYGGEIPAEATYIEKENKDETTSIYYFYEGLSQRDYTH